MAIYFGVHLLSEYSVQIEAK